MALPWTLVFCTDNGDTPVSVPQWSTSHDRHLEIRYADRDWLIEHIYFDRHVASITQDTYKIEWTLEKETISNLL